MYDRFCVYLDDRHYTSAGLHDPEGHSRILLLSNHRFFLLEELLLLLDRNIEINPTLTPRSPQCINPILSKIATLWWLEVSHSYKLSLDFRINAKRQTWALKLECRFEFHQLLCATIVKSFVLDSTKCYSNGKTGNN